MAGELTTVKVAHFKLSHSRMPFSIAYLRETQEMVFDAHDEAFKFFDGCCGKGIYDNMSTAVDAVLRGKDCKFNKTFPDVFASYGGAGRLQPSCGLGKRSG